MEILHRLSHRRNPLLAIHPEVFLTENLNTSSCSLQLSVLPSVMAPPHSVKQVQQMINVVETTLSIQLYFSRQCERRITLRNQRRCIRTATRHLQMPDQELSMWHTMTQAEQISTEILFSIIQPMAEFASVKAMELPRWLPEKQFLEVQGIWVVIYISANSKTVHLQFTHRNRNSVYLFSNRNNFQWNAECRFFHKYILTEQTFNGPSQFEKPEPQTIHLPVAM